MPTFELASGFSVGARARSSRATLHAHHLCNSDAASFVVQRIAIGQNRVVAIIVVAGVHDVYFCEWSVDGCVSLVCLARLRHARLWLQNLHVVPGIRIACALLLISTAGS